MQVTWLRATGTALLLAGALMAHGAGAQTQPKQNLAPGFTALPASAKVALIPADMELFNITAGGVFEPKADWTEAAQKNFRSGIVQRKSQIAADLIEVREADMDEFGELNALHGAVADAVFTHHTRGNVFMLPTKQGQMKWSLGEDAVRPLREKTGADYALFFWVRDSYASPERKAAMVAMALLRVGITGGVQVAYSSLVDLRTGQVMWFNSVVRTTGDLREAQPALETVEVLLKGFPSRQ